MFSGSPLLSIIVPNYNNESCLKYCIESILGQTYKNIEVIISDDASSDKSVSIIKKYEHINGSVIKGLYHDINRGVSFCRHSAILEAKGKYITTLDSDDYFYDVNKLEKEMDIVLGHRKKSNKDVCAFSNIALVSTGGDLVEFVGTPETIREGNLFDGIITRDCFIPRDFVLPKSAYFEVGGFDQTLNIYEDWDLKIRLSAKYEFYFSGINGVAYRQHDSGLSSVRSSVHVEALEKIFKKNIALAPEGHRADLAGRFGDFMVESWGYEVSRLAEPLRSEKDVSVFSALRKMLKSFMS